MTSLIRYTMADFVRSARFLWPTLVFLGILPIFYSVGGGPPLDGYGFTAVLLYPMAAWIGLLVAGSEDDIQRHLTITAAGSQARVLLAKTACGLLTVCALTAGAVAYPITLGLLDPPATRADVAVGVGAHLLCGVPGLALGLVFSRPSSPRQAHAWLWLLICLVLTVPFGSLASSPLPFVRWLATAGPPVLTVGRALIAPGPASVGPKLLAPAAASLTFSAVAIVLFLTLARTRA